MSRSLISRIENGGLDRVPLGTIERLAAALGARLDLALRWRGEALDRLLDDSHARLVDACVVLLRGYGWEVAPEVSFSVWGERGSIDILAFHAATSIALVVEVKSAIPDVQAMLSVLDRKTRLGATVAATRDWHARAVGRLLVVPRSATTYRRIERHAATFDVAFPSRNVAVRHWLAEPTAPGSGLLVVPSVHRTNIPDRRRRRRAS